MCRELCLLLVVVVTTASASQAEVPALHQGSNDPLAEGWSKYRPFLDVATFPVVNDLGTGIDAWAIDDNTGFGPPGHDGVYGVYLTPTELLEAETKGWILSVQLRIAEAAIGEVHDSIIVGVADSSNSYDMNFGRSASGKPLVRLTTGEDVGPLVEIDDLDNGYHNYQLVFNPADSTADFFVDGTLMHSNYAGRLGPFSDVGNVYFGSTSNNFTGQANYAAVSFVIVPEPAMAITMLVTVIIAASCCRVSRAIHDVRLA
jgi:hypothetical protein